MYMDNKIRSIIRNEIRRIIKEESNTDISGLMRVLKTHDWYYMMSDDENAYRRGRKNEKAIYNMVVELGEPALAVYNEFLKKYYPQRKDITMEEMKSLASNPY